jgi:hypothetical protein
MCGANDAVGEYIPEFESVGDVVGAESGTRALRVGELALFRLVPGGKVVDVVTAVGVLVSPTVFAGRLVGPGAAVTVLGVVDNTNVVSVLITAGALMAVVIGWPGELS